MTEMKTAIEQIQLGEGELTPIATIAQLAQLYLKGIRLSNCLGCQGVTDPDAFVEQQSG